MFYSATKCKRNFLQCNEESDWSLFAPSRISTKTLHLTIVCGNLNIAYRWDYGISLRVLSIDKLFRFFSFLAILQHFIPIYANIVQWKKKNREKNATLLKSKNMIQINKCVYAFVCLASFFAFLCFVTCYANKMSNSIRFQYDLTMFFLNRREDSIAIANQGLSQPVDFVGSAEIRKVFICMRWARWQQ